MEKSSETNGVNMREVSGFFLCSAYFTWKIKIERMLLPYELTHLQFILLMSIGFLKQDKQDEADVSQDDLARFWTLEVATISQVLDTLEKRSLLNSFQKEDEPFKYLELTDDGVRKVQLATKDFLEAEACFFSNLGENKEGFHLYLRDILRQQTEGFGADLKDVLLKQKADSVGLF